MKKISVETKLHHSRPLAYHTLRDRMAEVLQYVPNVSEIEVEEREEISPGVIHFVNIWHGEADDVPVVARPFIKQEMLHLTDYATWYEDDWRTEWRMQPSFMSERIDCHGENTYFAVDENTTILKIEGELHIDLRHFAGMPSILARRAAPAVEGFVVSLVSRNLNHTVEALQRFLDEEDKQAAAAPAGDEETE